MAAIENRMSGVAPSASHSHEVPEARFEDDDRLDFRTRVARFEARVIIRALKKSRGNQTRAAVALDLPLRTLVHKLKKLGIGRDDYRDV
jgi:DNA-binding NtrC family response regulator